MIEAEFTDEIGEKIVKAIPQRTSTPYCSGHVVYVRNKWKYEDIGCYYYTGQLLETTNHPDHFGIFHGGWLPLDKEIGSYPVSYDRPEVMWWLEALLDPKGMFAPVLPFLWKTEPADIIKDRAFVVKNALKSNAGLLWTFLQASRLMFENRERMDRFVWLRENHPELALLLTLTLQPFEANNPKGVWAPTIVAHGEPLGTQGWKRAGYVLAGKLLPRSIHGPARSAECFGGGFSLSYTNRPAPRPLETWINRFKEAEKNDRLVQA